MALREKAGWWSTIYDGSLKIHILPKISGLHLNEISRYKIKNFISVLVVFGLLTGLLSFGYQSYYFGRRLTEAQAQNEVLTKQNQELLQRNTHLRYINDLAIEFSMDPMIVMLVDHYSRDYLKTEGPEWRLLKTPEFLSYIMLSLIYTESKGRASAIGDEGKARGLTQIWVTTAKQYGDVTAHELLDPEVNISFAFKHFSHLLQKYRGNLAMALYAWNRGSSKVDKLLIYGESPQNGFGKKVYEAALLNNRYLEFKN